MPFNSEEKKSDFLIFKLIWEGVRTNIPYFLVLFCDFLRFKLNDDDNDDGDRIMTIL